ncbi:hypothetical protein [Pectobacterium cacticida]|uniref:hypothetical protein n=1 Tax=Pectobacterium cacticida TaxID=69221 RepID=UPI0035EDBDF0
MVLTLPIINARRVTGVCRSRRGKEWLPDSYTLPLFFFALYYSPLPTYIIQP